jgi:hypothetical protein
MSMVLIANAAAGQIQARKVPTAQIISREAIGVPNGNKAAKEISRRNVNQQGTNQSNAETNFLPLPHSIQHSHGRVDEKPLMARFLLKECDQVPIS